MLDLAMRDEEIRLELLPSSKGVAAPIERKDVSEVSQPPARHNLLGPGPLSDQRDL